VEGALAGSMKRRARKTERGGLDLIEEAAHLLRSVGASTWLLYYAGSIPFVLGFLYFWADMSRNPYASRHVAAFSLGVAILYLWMKHWQALFARAIRAQLAGETLSSLTLRDHLRGFVAQSILQTPGLVVTPLSVIPLGLPLAWVIAFFQSVSALGDPAGGDVSKLFKRACRQASLWPLQNHVALSLTALFGGCVFLNLCIAAYVLPGLIKMLFGVESIFTQSAAAMLNTTFLLVVAGATYLCIDPLLKVIYALRCFHGEAVESGEDIRSELRRFRVKPERLAAGLALLITLSSVATMSAQEPAAPAPVVSQPVSAVDLDRAISDVIQERKYTWRMPPTKQVAEGGPGVIARFFNRMGEMIRDGIRAVLQWINDFLRKLFYRKSTPGGGGSGSGWMVTQQILLFVLVAAVATALVLFLMRHLKRRKNAPGPIAADAVPTVPDLSDENVGADQMPEDGWTRLGRELFERGEYRLALRAFYLASLAHLAARNLIRIARHKSNRDYAIELQRRAHALPELLPLFGENLSVFERIWYGMHEVNPQLVTEFANRVERIRTP